MNAKTILSLDDIMDMDLGNVVTPPDYVSPSKGTYQLKVTDAGVKEGKDKDGEKKLNIFIEYAIEETVESDEPPFPNGSLFNERFTATEDGMGYFKKQAMKILNVKDLNGVTNREIFEGLKDAPPFGAAITTKITKGANGNDYTNINVRPLHETPAQ